VSTFASAVVTASCRPVGSSTELRVCGTGAHQQLSSGSGKELDTLCPVALSLCTLLLRSKASHIESSRVQDMCDAKQRKVPWINVQAVRVSWYAATAVCRPLLSQLTMHATCPRMATCKLDTYVQARQCNLYALQHSTSSISNVVHCDSRLHGGPAAGSAGGMLHGPRP
jgi:hypothetical protein